MIDGLRRGLAFAAATLLLFGGAYPGAFLALARVAFAAQAEGSLVRRADGTVIGSQLVAQPFTRDEYLHSRPSAVDYNAASTGGSNHGPTNPAHLDQVRKRLDAIMAAYGREARDVPADLVTTSGSGLDPHVSLASARLQAGRVARARGVAVERVDALIDRHTEGPILGMLGRARVNVLAFNLALDAELADGK